nr:EF-P beta-lysylation protein EpmB [Gammaproteobacteria bacterium]
IFSGGEPLLLKDELLARRIKDLEKIEHLKNLRIHTRLPIVIPARVTNELMQALTSRLNLIVVLHANHAQEFDAQVSLACQLLSRHTMALLNQTVLLKGVNDSSQVLVDLSHALFEHAVMPYYLHLLDAVKGAAHFNVTKTRALAIYQEVTHKLPGYLVPKLVQELPNQAAKQSVSL